MTDYNVSGILQGPDNHGAPPASRYLAITNWCRASFGDGVSIEWVYTSEALAAGYPTGYWRFRTDNPEHYTALVLAWR